MNDFIDMKKFLALFTIIILATSGMNAQKHSYRLNVGMFDKLNVTDNVNVECRCVPDSAGYIAFEGETEFADAFIFSNSKGKLRVQVNTDDVNNPNLPVLRVYSHFLTEVENGSDFTTTLEGKIAVPALSIKQIGNGNIIVRDIEANQVTAAIATGNGKISITGKCDIADLKMVGAGMIQSENLDAGTVNCHILGSGDIYCNPKQKLDVRGIGSTKIFYLGEPEIKKVGGGKIFPLDSKK